MKHFTKYNLNDFNYLLSEENQILETDGFGTVGDKIEDDGLNYFYISMRAGDVEEAMDDDPEMVALLGGLNLIEVRGDKLHFYIATY